MFRSPKSLFLAIPKTGTTWVEQVVRDCGIANDMVHINGFGGHDAWDIGQHWAGDRFVFTAVRNPLTWLPSVYRWMKKFGRFPGPCGEFHDRMTDGDGSSVLWDPRTMKYISAMLPDTFQGFVERYLDVMPGAITRIFEAYTCGCHFVCRQERLREDVCEALARAGESFDPGILENRERMNVTEGGAVAFWTPDLEAALRKSDSDVFEKYGW